MKANLFINDKTYAVNFDEGIDISLNMKDGTENPSCFYLGYPSIQAIRANSFIGSVAEGGACNCEEIRVSPHGHGTHTESVGHVSRERIALTSVLKRFHFLAQLITVQPIELPNGDRCISPEQIKINKGVEAIIIRTLPNTEDKKTKLYSGQNPCYFTPEATAFLAEHHIQHLLCDLPSVDREEDGGALAAHKAFWNYPEQTRFQATITELIYVEDAIPDDLYLLQIQITSLETDASPSKPVLYRLNDEMA